MTKAAKIWTSVGLGAVALGAIGFMFWRNRQGEANVVIDETINEGATKAGGRADNRFGAATNVGTISTDVGIGNVASIPIVNRPLAGSKLPIMVTNRIIPEDQQAFWQTVSVVERVAPKGNGIYVLTFKDRSKPVSTLKNGQQIAVETTDDKSASIFRGMMKVQKVWIDANGKLAGVYVQMKFPAMISKAIDAKFKANEYAAENQIVILRHK
jgi:hypothetical protein